MSLDFAGGECQTKTVPIHLREELTFPGKSQALVASKVPRMEETWNKQVGIFESSPSLWGQGCRAIKVALVRIEEDLIPVSILT